MPAWDKATGVDLVGPEGGDVVAGPASITFQSGALEQTHSIRIQHQRPSKYQTPEDVLVRVSGEEVQIGDRIVVSIEPQMVRDCEVELPTTAVSSTSALVEFPVFQPPSRPNADLYASAAVHGRTATKFERVTQSAGLRLFEKAWGATYLSFNAATGAASKAVSTVYDVVWSSSKSVAGKISSMVAQHLTNDGKEPLHIRIHYLCDPRGYPCRLLTVIAAGPPPQPEAGTECHDGLYTAAL